MNYGEFTKSFSYEYAANGQKSSFTMPDGTKYDYAYGDNNELRSITLPGAGSITYPSYTWTRPNAVVYPGGARRDYSYDPLMRVTQILAKDPAGNSVLDYSYSYDTIGNILSKQTEGGSYNYTYDALSRLTDVQVDVPGEENEGPGLSKVEGFGYDAVGNRLSQDGVEGEWNYNANNELLTFADTEYQYDENGNATQLLLNGAVMFTYHYNAQDRMVKVEDVNDGTIAEYAYDPFGRRLWKEVGGTRTTFFYADEGLVGEYDAAGNETTSYGYKPDSIWTTDPLWLKQNGEYYFYQNDHLGTPQKLVKQNGAVVWSASYSAFGQATVEVEAVTNNLRFPGQYYDAETGLHYNWMRYYHTAIGKFLTADPADRIINVYSYCVNNPIRFFDPYGLFHAGGNKDCEHGHGTFSNPYFFDYNVEDYDWNTHPFVQSWRHFRPPSSVQRDMIRAIFMQNCDYDQFERNFHQGQDFYTHYGKGFRWWLLGHVPVSLLNKVGLAKDPDCDKSAWKKAEEWTKFGGGMWEKYCCHLSGTWERKKNPAPGIIPVLRMSTDDPMEHVGPNRRRS